MFGICLAFQSKKEGVFGALYRNVSLPVLVIRDGLRMYTLRMEVASREPPRRDKTEELRSDMAGTERYWKSRRR